MPPCTALHGVFLVGCYHVRAPICVLCLEEQVEQVQGTEAILRGFLPER